nr:hypothetical protein [Streptomyces sp. BE133]
MFERPVTDGIRWSEGTTARADAVIWCTGFRPPSRTLPRWGCTAYGATGGTRTVGEPRLPLLGHSDWTGPASATLIGVAPCP